LTQAQPSVSPIGSFVRDLPIGKGLWKIFVALRNSPAAGHLWPLLSGALSLLVGFLIWRPWPLAGTSARGILVGVNVVSTGVALEPRRIHGPLQKAIFVASDVNATVRRALHSGSAWKVSQLATCPDFIPVMSQRARCSEEPCVNASGTT